VSKAQLTANSENQKEIVGEGAAVHIHPAAPSRRRADISAARIGEGGLQLRDAGGGDAAREGKEENGDAELELHRTTPFSTAAKRRALGLAMGRR
jgi:hypothetical protein